MSMYCSVSTEFKNPFALIDALMEIKGWAADQIEFNDIPMTLYGYYGDTRPEKANIIIRRRFIGGSSNDIGFIKNENKFVFIVSEYDKSIGYNEKFLAKLKCSYAYHIIRRTQEALGRKITRELLSDGRQRVIINHGR